MNSTLPDSFRWDRFFHVAGPLFGAAWIAALSALGGRGLEIVRTICRRWGVIEGEQGVTVWADVPRPAVGRRDLAAD